MGLVNLGLPNDGENIDASDVNNPFNTLANEFNGNIDNDNIKSAAGISGSKLAAKSVGSAQISDVSGPRGFLINGKISTSVATNDLTVAIKTLAGADPSTSDPVYVRIGDTMRSITSALSHTLADGTNWFNSGAASTATLEMDYFVYLGYNATDGVVIGFSRIPYARVYGDFSATSTNDKYAAISTITNAASTDEYEVVGRFNAILSATAAFNWSLPATSIVISRPIFNTRVLSFTPSWTNITQGSATNTGTYQIRDRKVDVKTQWIFGAGSAMGTVPVLTLPMTSVSYGSANVHLLGVASFVDSGTGTAYGVVDWATITTVFPAVSNVSGTYQTLTSPTSSIPMIWAAPDQLNTIFSYEPA